MTDANNMEPFRAKLENTGIALIEEAAGALFAPNVVALQPALLRRTARYACVAQASARLGVHLNPNRHNEWHVMCDSL